MKKQTYESAVLINAALDDEQIDQILSKIKDNITNNGGEVLEIDNWGRKRLAYTVKKNKIGYYAIFRFIAQPNIVAKLERLYTLDENILRFLTISLTKEALEQIEINKAKVIAETEEVIVPEVTPEILEGEGDEE
ncbi:MAG TPA: 30S ribosomal protein S6 [Ignavibacteriaceae bacterium]|nr:30S ribosomal protein S6 [Ignavibacteriaceae bacterium]